MDETPADIARCVLESSYLWSDEAGFMLSMRTLARAYLALTAPLRERCERCKGFGKDMSQMTGDVVDIPESIGACPICSGSGSVLTEDGKRIEEIRNLLDGPSPWGLASEVVRNRHIVDAAPWLLSRLTAALNEIERLKKEK